MRTYISGGYFPLLLGLCRELNYFEVNAFMNAFIEWIQVNEFIPALGHNGNYDCLCSLFVLYDSHDSHDYGFNIVPKAITLMSRL